MNIKKLVMGVGINDVYTSDIKSCPFYKRWRGIISRCYSATRNNKLKNYIGCTVSDEWLIFSNFKKWMESQSFAGMEIDKDIICVGNKIYAEHLCCFVTPMTNTFILDRLADRGQWPLGVSYDYVNSKYKATCSNPFTSKIETLGRFSTPELAHESWRRRKYSHALAIAALQSDSRVAQALRLRYA